jgi:hypothetical protein
MTDLPASWKLPSRPGGLKGPLPLAYGMHLMAGTKGSGKTVTSVGLGLWLKDEQVNVLYEYVMEPRASMTTALIKPGNWEKHLRAQLDKVKGGVLFVDSLTYLVSRLDAITELEKSNLLSNVTYSGGLSPRDILGILLHDALAREYEVALVATLNSELFPVVDKLAGASEGEFKLSAPGSFMHQDRTRRTQVMYKVPDEYMASAFAGLYPGAPVPVGSRSIDRY